MVQDGAHATGCRELDVVTAGADGRGAVRHAYLGRASRRERARRFGARARVAGGNAVHAGQNAKVNHSHLSFRGAHRATRNLLFFLSFRGAHGATRNLLLAVVAPAQPTYATTLTADPSLRSG